MIGEFPPEKSGTLARDGEEHVLVLYSFTGTLDLGDRKVMAPGGAASSAIALARYDQQGHLEWVKLFGPGPGVEGGGIFGRHVAVDSHRNILLDVGAGGVDLGDGQPWPHVEEERGSGRRSPPHPSRAPAWRRPVARFASCCIGLRCSWGRT